MIPQQKKLKKVKQQIALKKITKKETKEAKETLSSSSPASMQVKCIEAFGQVTLIHQDQIGTGDKGVYDAKKHAHVRGNATVGQGPNITQGEELIYNISTGETHMRGNVRSLFSAEIY